MSALVKESHTLDLEHASGLRPLGEYPDHCERCRAAHGCGHEERLNIYTWGSQVPTRQICERCGQDA